MELSRNNAIHFKTVNNFGSKSPFGLDETINSSKTKKPLAQIEHLDIQSIPRDVHISSKTDSRSIIYLQKQLRKEKFFHKEFAPIKNTDPKVKMMQTLGNQ